jgi:hypothetical protein
LIIVKVSAYFFIEAIGERLILNETFIGRKHLKKVIFTVRKLTFLIRNKHRNYSDGMLGVAAPKELTEI